MWLDFSAVDSGVICSDKILLFWQRKALGHPGLPSSFCLTLPGVNQFSRNADPKSGASAVAFPPLKRAEGLFNDDPLGPFQPEPLNDSTIPCTSQAKHVPFLLRSVLVFGAKAPVC